MRRREFLGYLDVMNKQIEGERASPDSWEGAANDPAWAELRAARERMRAR
jgi:hypothetical protein